MREILREILIREEGIRLKPYNDTKGLLTIGIGRNLDEVGVSKEEALMLMENDIERSEDDAKALFPTYGKISANRQAVLAAMAFQLGGARLAGFKNMRIRIAVGDYRGAADEMLDSKWAKEDSPARAHRMAELMRKG
jgi:lysozyme